MIEISILKLKYEHDQEKKQKVKKVAACSLCKIYQNAKQRANEIYIYDQKQILKLFTNFKELRMRQ